MRESLLSLMLCGAESGERSEPQPPPAEGEKNPSPEATLPSWKGKNKLPPGGEKIKPPSFKSMSLSWFIKGEYEGALPPPALGVELLFC